MIRYLIALALLALTASPALAITIGGKLGDWGLTSVGGFSNADRVGQSVTGTHNGISYWEEEGYTAQGTVEPGWGGKTFDIAGLYAKVEGNTLYIASILGTPWWRVQGESIGDIWVGTGAWGSDDYAIETRGRNKGRVKTGGYPSNTSFQSSAPDNMTGRYTFVDRAQFVYATFMDGYYYMEAALEIPQSLVNQEINIHLTQTCGNDVADLTIKAPVPEPATLLLMGAGCIGFGLLRSRRRL